MELLLLAIGLLVFEEFEEDDEDDEEEFKE